MLPLFQQVATQPTNSAAQIILALGPFVAALAAAFISLYNGIHARAANVEARADAEAKNAALDVIHTAVNSNLVAVTQERDAALREIALQKDAAIEELVAAAAKAHEETAVKDAVAAAATTPPAATP